MNGETFCLYCQKEFKNDKNLRKHLELKHKGTYAYYTVNLDKASKVSLEAIEKFEEMIEP